MNNLVSATRQLSNSATQQLSNSATQQLSNLHKGASLKRFAFLILIATTAFAQQQNDADYTRQIKQFTTGPQFITEMVDHLPLSAKVPTPLKFFGYIAGADGHLTYSQDVNRYMRALEAASPRVKVFSIGKSEEGREMIAVAVGADDTIAHLDRYRDITKR